MQKIIVIIEIIMSEKKQWYEVRCSLILHHSRMEKKETKGHDDK